MSIKVTTNNVPRYTVDAWDLTPAERAGFDYLDWPAIDKGKDSATFFRYRGQLYDLGNFVRGNPIPAGSDLPAHLARWDAYMSESAFSAMVLRLADDDLVIVGYVTT